MTDSPSAASLAEVLSSPAASWDDRLDAATLLRMEAGHVEQPDWFVDESVLDALAAAASDPADDAIAQEAAEALANVWMKKGWIDSERLRSFAPSAKADAREYIQLNAPHLLVGIE